MCTCRILKCSLITYPTYGVTEVSESRLGKVPSCFLFQCTQIGVGVMLSFPAGLQGFSSCHWIVQNGSFCSRVSSGIESSFGELSPAAPLPPIGPPPGGHTDCHLSARVDTMGGRMGLLSKILSSSFIVLVFSLGTSCKMSSMINCLQAFYSLLHILQNDLDWRRI